MGEIRENDSRMSPIELGREGRGKRSEGESLNVAQCAEFDVYKVVDSVVLGCDVSKYLLLYSLSFKLNSNHQIP